jgi:hypothetical protein
VSGQTPAGNPVDALITDDVFARPPSWKADFLAAMRWSFSHHAAGSDFFGGLCADRGFDVERLGRFEDVFDIPYILTDVFKRYPMATRGEDRVRSELVSSGTSGEHSRIVLDRRSSRRLLIVTRSIYRALGLASEASAVNCLVMSYNPAAALEVATSNADALVASLTPRRSVFHALDLVGGEMRFLLDEAVEKLREFVQEGLPVRILGFLHHTCETVLAYRERYGRLELPPRSYLLSGGGWKTFAQRYGPEFDLHRFLREHTDIDPSNVRDAYSLVEQPVSYVECERHHKHVPNVAAACARHPRSLRRLQEGETGLLHLLTPIIDSYPCLSVLTTDLGSVGGSCPCALGGPYLTVVGRIGGAGLPTCALTADQYIPDRRTWASAS